MAPEFGLGLVGGVGMSIMSAAALCGSVAVTVSVSVRLYVEACVKVLGRSDPTDYAPIMFLYTTVFNL